MYSIWLRTQIMKENDFTTSKQELVIKNDINTKRKMDYMNYTNESSI